MIATNVFLPVKSMATRNILLLVFLFIFPNLFAQQDIIFKKDSTEIPCKILKAKGKKYLYTVMDTSGKEIKKSILKSLVDSVQYNLSGPNVMDTATHEKKEKVEVENEEEEEIRVKPYEFTFGIGLNVGHIMELNPPSGNDKKSFSATCAIDLGLNYFKEGKRFSMTNELHWIISAQKAGLTNADHIQRATDELSTLHDFSVAMNKNNKWNFNLIAKSSTSVFTLFDGDFFKDFNHNGKTQGFLNPYQVTLSPGIKYQPNDYFRFSISPYSVSLYGLTNQQIANTGFYTTAHDINNNYDLFVFKQLGAELNIWYDRKIKNWLELQYRFGISSDYFTNIAKNGLMDGLFITKVKLIKNVYLSHRASLQGDLAGKPFKPYYNQTILLSFAKSF